MNLHDANRYKQMGKEVGHLDVYAATAAQIEKEVLDSAASSTADSSLN